MQNKVLQADRLAAEASRVNLDRLLKPRAVAIVGANDRSGSFGNYSAINALQNGEDVRVYLVNKKSPRVCGQKTYKSLSALPEVPDCIMVATPKAAVESVLEEAGSLGVGAAILVAAGYGEEGTEQGRADEERLADIGRRYNMAIMGPNCIGLLNNIDKVKLWGMGGSEFDMNSRRTGVAFFAQSGTMSIHAISCPYLDVSYVFSMGNSSMVMTEDLLEYVLEEDEVRMVAIYLEGVRDGRRFLRCLARAAQLGKPVVLHAAGMSEKGAVAAASHTGNLASSRGVYQAVCEKYNVLLVESIDEFLCATNVLSTWIDRMPRGGKVSAVNGSGGENAVCADLSELYGVPLHDFQPETIQRLREFLPVFANPRNPLDITAITDDVDTVMRKTLRTIGNDPGVDAIICSIATFAEPNEKDLRQAEVMGESLNERYARPMIRYMAEPDSVPCLVIPMVEDRRDPVWRERLKASGIPVLGNSLVGYKVLGKISRYLEKRGEVRTLEQAAPGIAPGTNTVAMSEYDAKRELSDRGFPVPRQALVRTEEELLEWSVDLRKPLVLKISSPDILHKTEAGGVRLNITSTEEALQAREEILANCAAYRPDARMEGILMQEMAPAGVEMILGVTRDSQFGPMLMLGMGGVFVEVFGDVAMYPCPLGPEEALEMITSLKAYKLLRGYRGGEPCDVEALAELMVKLSRYAAEQAGALKELDLNPVFVYPQGKGVCAVDALIVKYTD